MIDLHMHSKYSDDGEYEPLDLVEKCFENTIKIMSVTDHNCVKANAEAEALLKKTEYSEHPLLKPYRPGGARSGNPYVNFYWDFYAQGKPCYVKMEYPSMEEVIDIIHANHGAAVLAHPGVNLKDHFDLTDEILDLGFDGAEVFSSYHGLPEAEFFYKKAQEKQLRKGLGSNFIFE